VYSDAARDGGLLMPTVAQLNAMTEVQSSDLLRACCGASRWVGAMVRHRPFGNREDVLAAAGRLWRALTPADWEEAFRHHPRIGDSHRIAVQDERAHTWSKLEQAGVGNSDADVRKMLAAVNEEYERRFGFVYIVNATGKTADEMLLAARTRMTNSPDAELCIAASEHEQIMLNRLNKLFDDDHPARSSA
jgi:2-oxo-4-hydroxy-4-carboxy-5-ureidoimidazoline decarboxylase